MFPFRVTVSSPWIFMILAICNASPATGPSEAHAPSPATVITTRSGMEQRRVDEVMIHMSGESLSPDTMGNMEDPSILLLLKASGSNVQGSSVHPRSVNRQHAAGHPAKAPAAVAPKNKPVPPKLPAARPPVASVAKPAVSSLSKAAAAGATPNTGPKTPPASKPPVAAPKPKPVAGGKQPNPMHLNHMQPGRVHPHIRDLKAAPKPNSIIVVDPKELKKDGLGSFVMFQGETRVRLEREPGAHHGNIYKVLDSKHQEGKPLEHYTESRPEIGDVVHVRPGRVYWKGRKMYAKFRLPVKKYKNALELRKFGSMRHRYKVKGHILSASDYDTYDSTATGTGEASGTGDAEPV